MKLKGLLINTFDEAIVYYRNNETGEKYEFLAQVDAVELRTNKWRKMRYCGHNIFIEFKRNMEFKIRVKDGCMYVW